MKRFITVLLVISMVIGLVPVFAVTAAETKASGITIDGKIDDWAGLHTVGVVSDGEFDGKKVTFYGKLTEQGLYLAADAYHGTFTTTAGSWHENTNFEIFVNRNRGNGNQHWVSAWEMGTTGVAKTSNGNMVATMVNETVSNMGAATQHTVAEVFFPIDKFDFVKTTQEHGTINVGMAWKTVGDRFNNAGTEGNGVGTMEWVFPVGSRPQNNNKLVVTAEGVYTEAQYYPDYFSYIPRKAQWSYLTATQNPDAAGEGWNTTVNPSWALGNAPFGNRADGYLNTWGTTDNPADGTQNNAYLWVAKEFTVEDINALEGVSLFTKMFFDDHIKLYINGKLVFSNDSWNGGYDRNMLAYDASSVLKEGKNVIAASLHQHHGGHEFDLELYATNLPQDRNNNLPSYTYIQDIDQYMEFAYICNVLSARSNNNTTGKYIYLETDLDFSGKSWTPLTTWKGVLDGQGHTVSGITAVTDATSGDYGLIVNIASNNNFNGTVKNLTVCDSIIVADKTNGYVGGIMGHSNRGIVENCTIDNVTVIGGNGAGAAVGWTQWSSDGGSGTYVSNCTVNDTTVIANNYAAGLVGAYKDADIIVNKHTLSNVIVKANATDNLANPIGSSVVRESAEGSTADVTKTADKTIAITDGAASTFDSTAPENIVITTSASAMAVKSVKVANKEVAFSVVPGDAVSVITIDSYDLSALANGEYDVAIVTYEGDLNAKLTVVGYLDGVALKGFTANLGGEIGLNFHMELSEEILNDPSANVQFTVDWAHDPIPVANGTPSKDIEGAYIFTCRVPVKQINSDISVKVVSDSGESVTYVYSVADYASYIVNAEEGRYSAETKALANSMLHYGATAQIALNYKPGFLPDYTAPEITAPDLTAYKNSVINDGAAAIDYLGGSATLDSAIELNYYFAVKDGTEVTADTFKAIGKTVTVVDASMPEGVGEEYETGWSCYIVTVQNISAKDYNKYYTVEAAVGGETLTVGYSVYTYVAKAIESTGTENANAAIAAYHYSECAKAYFASKNA